MPRGGHNRKPRALKIITGTNQKSRSVENEAEIAGADDAEPPKDLVGVALVVWKETAPVLQKTGILKQTDLRQLKNYCQQWAIIEKADEEIQSRGVLIEAPNGSLVKNPAITAHKDASTAMRGLSATLGLDPAARSRIDVGGSKKVNGFSDL